MLTSGRGESLASESPFLPETPPGQTETVLISPDAASNLIGGIAVATLLLFLAARELVVSFIQQESLNPERRALLLRLQSFLYGAQAPIAALFFVFVMHLVWEVR